MILLSLAIGSLVVCLGSLVEVWWGSRRLVRLEATPSSDPTRPQGHEPSRPDRSLPSLSIVIPARNEARHIEQALTSVLALDYTDLQVLVVDDRSTDDTPHILARLQAAHPRLRVARVEALPDGWLGKTHALAFGAARTTGELLLFTDADVVFAPDSVWRAVNVLESRRLDHLAVAPTIHTPTPWLSMAVATFAVFFTLHTRPWRAARPRSREHVGIGAFTLVRRAAYEAIGGHSQVALCPDDDLQWGRAVKQAGFRQELAVAGPLIAVEWYASVRELVAGLMKNAFPAMGYSVWRVAGACLALLLVNVWPFVALMVTTGVVWWANVAVVAALVALLAVHTRLYGAPVWTIAGHPAATLLFCWILGRSTWLALSTGSIEWRGRRYPLADLRAARLR